jgi:hypothetical protein
MRSLFILLLLTFSAHAAEPTYHAQSERNLMNQPYTFDGRMLEFYRHGMYHIDSLSEGKELIHGAYSLFGNVLTLDPDTPRQMSCRYSFDFADLSRR